MLAPPSHLSVRRVHCSDLLVVHFGQPEYHAVKVLSHVRVGPVPYREVGHLVQ